MSAGMMAGVGARPAAMAPPPAPPMAPSQPAAQPGALGPEEPIAPDPQQLVVMGLVALVGLAEAVGVDLGPMLEQLMGEAGAEPEGMVPAQPGPAAPPAPPTA